MLKVSLYCVFITFICAVYATSEGIGNSWLMFMRDAKSLVNGCPPVYSRWQCIENSSLAMFDKLLAADIIPFTDHVRLVRGHNAIVAASRQHHSRYTWMDHVLHGFIDAMQTHVLEIDLTSSPKEIGRHRRRGQHMLPMMMFGATAFGVMSFQFLAMLSGKALLLAKMALLLASVNGIKRIATSGVHYGFYHTGPPEHQAPLHQHQPHLNQFFDRDGRVQPRRTTT